MFSLQLFFGDYCIINIICVMVISFVATIVAVQSNKKILFNKKKYNFHPLLEESML